jgi:preprotein translocase subunit SecE
MGKVIEYFIEVKNELAKVVWPSRKDTVRYTLVVIGFALAMAIILGATDYGLTQLITKFINR